MKAWQKPHTFRAGASPRPWFLAIVANECRMARRRRGCKGPVIVRGRQLDGPAGMPLERASDLGSSPVDAHGVEIGSAGSSGWRMWTGRIAHGIGPGCYGLHADGFDFTSQIVFAIQAGPPPAARSTFRTMA